MWSKYELCQFLRNESVMSLMENHEEEQFVSRNQKDGEIWGQMNVGKLPKLDLTTHDTLSVR